MSEPSAEETRPPLPPETPDEQTTEGALSSVDFNQFIQQLELGAIELVTLAAERHAAGQPPQTRFNMTAGWQRNDAAVLWRYDVTAQLTDDDSTDYGFVTAALLLPGRTSTEAGATDACLEHFSRTSGLMICYPFLREAIANTALRLGFVGITLPVITLQPGATAAAWTTEPAAE